MVLFNLKNRDFSVTVWKVSQIHSVRDFLQEEVLINLVNELSLARSDIHIKNTWLGKPELAASTIELARKNIWWNISHSGEYAALIYSTRAPVGIDIERVRFRKRWPIQQVVNGEGQKKFFSLSADEQMKEFYRLWTCNEAALKAMGVGLTGDSLQIDQVMLHSCFLMAGVALSWGIMRRRQ